MRQRLVEVFNRDWTDEKAQIIEKRLEEKTMVEAAGKSFASVGKSYYEVPVWRLDKQNLNNRIYSTKLAEKIKGEYKVTCALKDHPGDNDDGSVDRIVAVGKNPHIREGILWADCYFVDDEFHKKVEKILEHGGNIGLSSSGDGSVDDQGYVLEEDYSLQRYFDFVLTPSYEVYLTKESLKSPADSVFESASTNKETIESSEQDRSAEPLNEVKATKLEEKKMATSFEEKNFRMGIASLHTQYESAVKPADKLKILETILDYCDGVEIAADEYKKAKAEMSVVKESLLDLAEKGAVVEELEDSVQSSMQAQSELQEELEKLTQSYNTALEMLESFKIREDKLKELVDLAKAERAGMAKASELKEMMAFIDSIEQQMKELKEENKQLRKDKALFEARFKKSLTAKQRYELDLAKLKESLEDEIGEDGEEKGEFNPEELEGEEGEQTVKVKDANVTIEDADEIEVVQAEGGEEGEEDDMFADLDLRNTEEIEDYYEDVVRQNPNARKIEKQLKKCKTLFEAQRTYLALEDLINGTPRQSTNKSNLLETGTAKRKSANTRTAIREGWM